MFIIMLIMSSSFPYSTVNSMAPSIQKMWNKKTHTDRHCEPFLTSTPPFLPHSLPHSSQSSHPFIYNLPRPHPRPRLLTSFLSCCTANSGCGASSESCPPQKSSVGGDGKSLDTARPSAPCDRPPRPLDGAAMSPKTDATPFPVSSRRFAL